MQRRGGDEGVFILHHVHTHMSDWAPYQLHGFFAINNYVSPIITFL